MIRTIHPLQGLCYVLAEILYHSKPKESTLRPYRATWRGVSHWWLEDDKGEIVDPTASQFANSFPYYLGKPAGFLTSHISARAAALQTALERAQYKGPKRGRSAGKSTPIARQPKRKRASASTALTVTQVDWQTH